MEFFEHIFFYGLIGHMHVSFFKTINKLTYDKFKLIYKKIKKFSNMLSLFFFNWTDYDLLAYS